MAGRLTPMFWTRRLATAAGVRIMLYRVTGNSHKKIGEATTNADGRTDAPMLEGKAFSAGTYELVFAAGIICARPGRRSGRCCSSMKSRSALRGRCRAHYHVPLLISPTPIPPIAAAEAWGRCPRLRLPRIFCAE